MLLRQVFLCTNMRLPFIFLLILFSILATRYFFFFSERHVYAVGEEISLKHTFLQEPKRNTFGQYFFANDMLISLPLTQVIGYGESVKIDGVVTQLESKDSDRLLTVKNPEIKKLPKSELLAITGVIRQKIIDAFEIYLPPKESGLLLGIVLGIKDKIDPEYYQRLRDVGVLHVVAASGSNVSLVAGFLLGFFSIFVKRRGAILFTVLGILFYSLISGFDPPIVRASLMAIFAFAALAFGKQNYSAYILIVTAFLMLFIKPELISDSGFQLSFASTAGIIYIKPIVDRVLHYKVLKFVKDDIGTTIAAQLATIPIMLSAFSSYSLSSIVVNALLLWTIPPLMVAGGLASITSIIWSPLSMPFLALAHPFLWYFETIVNLTSKFAGRLEVGSIPVTLLCGYYLLLLTGILAMRKRT